MELSHHVRLLQVAAAQQYNTSASGYGPLRRWAEEHMQRMHSPPSPHDVIITTGSNHACDVSRSLRNSNRSLSGLLMLPNCKRKRCHCRAMSSLPPAPTTVVMCASARRCILLNSILNATHATVSGTATSHFAVLLRRQDVRLSSKS